VPRAQPDRFNEAGQQRQAWQFNRTSARWNIDVCRWTRRLYLFAADENNPVLADCISVEDVCGRSTVACNAVD